MSIELSRDPENGGLITPFVATVNARAEELAERDGGAPAQHYSRALADISRKRVDLTQQHDRLMVAVANNKFHLLHPGEQAALDRLAAREAAAAKAAALGTPVVNSGGLVELANTIHRKLGGEPEKFSTALHEAARLRPDLAQEYLGIDKPAKGSAGQVDTAKMAKEMRALKSEIDRL